VIVKGFGTRMGYGYGTVRMRLGGLNVGQQWEIQVVETRKVQAHSPMNVLCTCQTAGLMNSVANLLESILHRAKSYSQVTHQKNSRQLPKLNARDSPGLNTE